MVDHAASHEYRILEAQAEPEFKNLWQGPVWGKVPHLGVDCFRPESTDHRPHTTCKLLFDDDNLFGHFQVSDRYIRSTHTGFQNEVYRDSCVEVFLLPKKGYGYFNFEFNCGGAALASYVTDPTRSQGGALANAIPLSPEQGRRLRIRSSLPPVVEPEIISNTVWYLEFSLPFEVLEEFVGPVCRADGAIWRANLYKCGNDTSHPHWASWTPIDALNFHTPRNFGTIRFTRRGN